MCHKSEDTFAYEKEVMRNPVKPKPAVQAGMNVLKKFTTRIIAKEPQKERLITLPRVPTLSVATGMLALNPFIESTD